MHDKPGAHGRRCRPGARRTLRWAGTARNAMSRGLSCRVQVAHDPHGVVGGRNSCLHPGAAVVRNLPAWGPAGKKLMAWRVCPADPGVPRPRVHLSSLAVGAGNDHSCRWSRLPSVVPRCVHCALVPCVNGAHARDHDRPQVTGRCCVRMAVLAFFGVPHGATDHLVAASIFRRSFPRCWLLVFVLVR